MHIISVPSLTNMLPHHKMETAPLRTKWAFVAWISPWTLDRWLTLPLATWTGSSAATPLVASLQRFGCWADRVWSEAVARSYRGMATWCLSSGTDIETLTARLFSVPPFPSRLSLGRKWKATERYDSIVRAMVFNHNLLMGTHL